MNHSRRSATWLAVQLGLGLLWIAVLAITAQSPGARGLAPREVALMLGLAGWLPSLPLAIWQLSHRRFRTLLLSDLLGAGLLVLLACTAYLPLFFFHVAWFIPLALLPRGVITEVITRLGRRLLANRQTIRQKAGARPARPFVTRDSQF